MRRMSSPPAWGPAAVENAPLTISAKAPTTLGARARRAARDGRRAPRRESREERGREAGRHDRDEEVAHHEQRVEVEEHRHGPQRNLRERQQRGAAGEAATETIADLPRRQVGEHGSDDARERDRTVGELDHGVVVERRHGLALAEWPVGAAESRAGEAHERARGDVEEHREHEQPRDQRESLRVMRDHTAPGALREPGGFRQRSHREQLRVLLARNSALMPVR